MPTRSFKMTKARQIMSKFKPPAGSGSLLSRRRLLDKINEGLNRRLVLIHGPAGFGKTTLAVQWRQVLIERGARVAWLSLDTEDDELERFLCYMVEAIRYVEPSIGIDAISLLEGKSEQATSFVLTDLVNELEVFEGEIFLVLDDWHLIRNEAIQKSLVFLIEHAPSNLHLIIASRTQPPLPLGTLRVQSQLTEIDSVDLRFDVDESSTFLRELNQLDVDSDDVQLLWRTTEGWIAALQLASISLRSSSDTETLIHSFSGKHQAIGKYLVENVLNNLPAATLDFLMKTSILESLSGDLCAAVTGRADSQALLERLQEEDMFVRALDEEMQWFRYHHLFADFLRRRLERDHPEMVASLHRAASAWFAAQLETEEAVRHALAAGDIDRAIELVERDAMWLVHHSLMATLLRLINRLPRDRIANRCELQFAIAWANCLTHHSSEAQKALEHIERSLGGPTLPNEDSIRAEAQVVQSCIDIFADRLTGVEALLRPLIADVEANGPWVTGVGANVLTYVLIQTFRYEEALSLQRWAISLHERNPGPFSGVYGHCFAGMAEFALGQLTQAEESFSEALRLARNVAGRHSHAAQLAGALLGQLLYERNALGDAELLLEDSRTLGVEGGVGDFSIATYIYSCRLEVLNERYGDAHAILDEGAHIARKQSIERLAHAVESERIKLYLLQGDLRAADQLLIYLDEIRPAPATEEPGIAHQLHEIRQRSRVRVLSAKGEYPAAVQILNLLIADAQKRGRRLAEMQSRAQLACVLEIAGNRAEAEATLIPAVIYGASEGMFRTFLDEGPRLISVLERLRDRCRHGQVPAEMPPTSSYTLATIIAAGRQERRAPAQRSTQPTAATPTIEPLKARELDILKMLSQGRSNKEISRDLGVGIDTVKWYLKGIYAKLGVARRVQATSAARRLGLLS
jgi:serine/threonine-protein kinase PknK